MKNKEKLVSYCKENNLPILHKQTDFGDMLYTKWGNMTVNMYRLTDMSASYVPINVFKAAHEAWREGKNYVVFFPKDSYAEYFMPISRAVKDWRMLMNKDCIYCDKEHVLKNHIKDDEGNELGHKSKDVELDREM